jgi:DNA mismatch repair protein MSH2
VLQKELAGEVTVHRLLKNGVYFSNKELQQLGSKKHDLLVDYENSQREIVQNAMSIAVSYIPVLERASELIAELDVLASLAHVAAFSPHGYCRPEITDNDDDNIHTGIVLKEARHPCVELQDNIDFIPNDFKLVHGESSFLLVTGPNMGGKSTYIRSLGAIIVMAQIGSYVPCTSAKINIVHHLLARVGAGDVQDRGISTFMAEMLETSSILRTATKRSLIIIDELGKLMLKIYASLHLFRILTSRAKCQTLGRGTSTFDGYGLARAISEYIVQRIGCTTVFATHFHELTAMEQTEKAVKNCHVTAKQATDGSNGLSFLYEVRHFLRGARAQFLEGISQYIIHNIL